MNTSYCLLVNEMDSPIHNCTMEDLIDIGDDFINMTADCWNSTVAPTTQMAIPREAIRLSGGRCEDGLDFWRWFATVVVTPPIVTFGVIGNVLAFIVLCCQKPFVTTSLLLRYLAVIDTLILLAAIPLRILRYVQICHGVMSWYHNFFSLHIFFWGYPCIYILRMAETWLITILTVDRFIAVCKPFHANRIVTKTLVYMQILLISIFSVICSLPTFFEFNFVKTGNTLTFTYRSFAVSHAYVFGYKVTFMFLVMYIVPMAFMTIFNTTLALGLRVAAKDRALLNRSVSSESARLNNSVTAIVIAIVITFFICNAMALVAHTLFSLTKIFETLVPVIDEPRRYLTLVSDVFITLNSAVNFLIYCVFSRSFRTTFVRTFSCRAVTEVISRKQRIRQSNSSSHTYLSLLSNGRTNQNNRLGSKTDNATRKTDTPLYS